MCNVFWILCAMAFKFDWILLLLVGKFCVQWVSNIMQFLGFQYSHSCTQCWIFYLCAFFLIILDFFLHPSFIVWIFWIYAPFFEHFHISLGWKSLPNPLFTLKLAHSLCFLLTKAKLFTFKLVYTFPTKFLYWHWKWLVFVFCWQRKIIFTLKANLPIPHSHGLLLCFCLFL